MDDKKKIEEALSESEIQEKKLRAAKAARKRRKRIKSLIGWLVVILIVSLVLVWFLKMKKDSEAQIEALKNMNTQVEATVEKSTYDREIDISGYVVPYDTLEAKFRSTGAVTGVYVSEGDYVKEGQILATIDDTQQRMNLQDIENQIAEAKLSGSAKTLELLEMRKKNYENALDYTTLKANFDGVVSKVDVVVNDYFDAGSSAVTIIDKSKLKTTIEIDEIDIQYVELGQKAILHFDSVPGVDVELTIDNPPEALIPGFTFSGTLTYDGEVEMLLVPSSAVKTGRGGQTTVTVKNLDGTTTEKKVTVQYLGEGMSQVLSGLKEGEVVVYEPSNNNAFSMMMGMMGR